MKTEFEYKVDDLEIISDFDLKRAGFIKSNIYFYTDKKPYKFYYFECRKIIDKLYFKTKKTNWIWYTQQNYFILFRLREISNRTSK